MKALPHPYLTKLLPWLVATLVGLAVFGLYSPGLDGPRLLDDDSVLKILTALQGHPDWATVRLILSDGNAGSAHRPIAMLTFIANYLSTGSAFRPFKITNVLIHLATGAAIYFFIVQILLRLRQGAARQSALLLTLVWLCLPLQVSTVLYVVQRMAQLVTLFSFLSLGFYVFWRRRLSAEKPAPWALAGFLMSTTLALLCKENAALIAPFIIILEWLLLLPSETSSPRRRALTRFYGGVSVIGLVASLWILIFHGSSLMHYENRDFTLSQRLLTEPRVLLDYLQQIFIPNLAEIGIFHDDYPLSYGLLTPPATLFAIVFWASLATLAVLLRHRRPLFAFGILFFLVGQSMESSFISLELYFDHRNYLPSVGLILAIFALLQPLRRQHTLLLSVTLLYIALMSALTAMKAADFSSLDTMMFTNLQRHPHSHRLLSVITEKSAYEGRWDIANRFARRMIAENDVYAGSSYIEYYGLLCRENRQPLPSDAENFARALMQQKNSLSYMTSSLDFMNSVFEEHHCASPGFARYALTMYDWQKQYFATRARVDRESNWSLRLYIAQALMDQKQYPPAEELYADLWQSHEVSIAGLDLAQLQCQLGQYTRCAQTLAVLRSTQTDVPAFAVQSMNQLTRDIYEHQHHPAGQK